MYDASGSGAVWGDPGVSGTWRYYEDPNIEPEDPTVTYSFEASGTNLNGEELNFSYSAEGIDNLDLGAIPSGTTLTVTVIGLSEAENGYQSVVSGVNNFDSETSTFTYKITSNTSLTITQTQVINNGLYLFGSMMMVDEGDGG
jgi:hypothetical protein